MIYWYFLFLTYYSSSKNYFKTLLENSGLIDFFKPLGHDSFLIKDSFCGVMKFFISDLIKIFLSFGLFSKEFERFNFKHLLLCE